MRGGSFIDEADSTDDDLYGQCDEGDDPCCQARGSAIVWRRERWEARKAPSEAPISHRPGVDLAGAQLKAFLTHSSQTAASRLELGTCQDPPGPNRG